MQSHQQLEYGFPHGQLPQQQVGVAQTAMGQNHMMNNAGIEEVSGGNQDDYAIKSLNNLSIFAKPRIKTTKGRILAATPRKDAEMITDGLPAKKRGPKRDSKPAQSRRQELNRHAQRLAFSSCKQTQS